MWVTRRTHGADGGRVFGYARGQGAMMFGFAFVCLVETLTMSVLLRDYPTVHQVVFVLDVYTLVFVVGVHAASVVRPHVLGPDVLRIRRAVHVDLRIPVDRIATVRRELRTTHVRADGELDIPVGAQTTVTLELTEPVDHFGFLGRRRDIRLVRFHADDADILVQALGQALLPAVTRARNAPSTMPDPPG
ncbi:hypothetical protein ACIBW9_04135 [Streptomyces sp. NPDC049541]|uniref:hypothetical protein n=1 Tax=Streptomyces sp. NPDC049541 TaxID=3365594 RepID=UPI00379EF834